jgi:hydrogenase/urease accessory protein HupE
MAPASLVMLGLALLAAAPRAGAAHPLAPLLLEVREVGNGQVEVGWKTPLLLPQGARPAPALPARCHARGPAVTTAEEAGVRARWTVECGAPGLTGERIGVDGLAEPMLALVRVVLADGRVVQRLVSAGAPAIVVPPRPRPWDTFRDYAVLGVEHILAGPDHLLFVFGLVLLAATPRRLLGTITAFTLGHSVTLSLAVLGVARVPSRPLELGIAASVLALAIELAREPARPTLMRRWPWAMAAAFGLLHGLGFAAALGEAGLPAGDIPLALLAFNLGIEAGQVAFVLVVLGIGRALAVVGIRLPHWTRRVPVYAMGSLAAFWCWERAAALFR